MTTLITSCFPSEDGERNCSRLHVSCSNIILFVPDLVMVQFVEINGASLAYELVGPKSAPLIITLHGGRGFGMCYVPELQK